MVAQKAHAQKARVAAHKVPPSRIKCSILPVVGKRLAPFSVFARQWRIRNGVKKAIKSNASRVSKFQRSWKK